MLERVGGRVFRSPKTLDNAKSAKNTASSTFCTSPLAAISRPSGRGPPRWRHGATNCQRRALRGDVNDATRGRAARVPAAQGVLLEHGTLLFLDAKTP